MVLARLLGPHEYGVFAVAALIISFSSLVADAGIGSFLVRSENVEKELVDFVAACQWSTGVVTASAVWLLSAHIAHYFSQPEAKDILRVMSVICIVNAIGSVPANLLRRQLDFKRIHFAQVLGFLIGYVFVGIPLALAGAKVWSLAAAWTTQALVSTALNLYWAPRPVRPSFNRKGSAEAIRFGVAAITSNLATWAANNADRVVVAKFFPGSVLGVYSTLSNLLSTAVAQVLSTLQPVLFSATARLSSDLSQVRRAYLVLVELGAIIFFPVACGVSLVPNVIVMGLYGRGWSHGAELLTPISLAIGFYGFAGLLTPLAWGLGVVGSEARMQVISAIIIGVAAVSASLVTDIAGVAWAVFVCVAVRMFLILRITAKAVGAGYRSMLSRMTPGLVIAFVVAALAYLARRPLADMSSASPTGTLTLTCLLGGVVYVSLISGALYLLGSDDVKRLIRRSELSLALGKT